MVRLVSVFLLSLICFIGCATRTKYKPMAKDGGYAETEISNNLYMVYGLAASSAVQRGQSINPWLKTVVTLRQRFPIICIW
jgi:hypothetical protein